MQAPVLVVGRADLHHDSLERLKDAGFEIGVLALDGEMPLADVRVEVQKLLADHAILSYEPSVDWRFLDCA